MPAAHSNRWVLLVTVAAGLLLIVLDNFNSLRPCLPDAQAWRRHGAQGCWIINAYPSSWPACCSTRDWAPGSPAHVPHRPRAVPVSRRLAYSFISGNPDQGAGSALAMIRGDDTTRPHPRHFEDDRERNIAIYDLGVVVGRRHCARMIIGFCSMGISGGVGCSSMCR